MASCKFIYITINGFVWLEQLKYGMSDRENMSDREKWKEIQSEVQAYIRELGLEDGALPDRGSD